MSANFSSCADLACFKPYRSPVIVRLENISIIMVSAWLILPDMEKRHVTAMMKKALCVHVHSSLLCLSLTNVDQELQAFVATGEKIFEMVINKEQTKPVLILVLRVTWKSNLIPSNTNTDISMDIYTLSNMVLCFPLVKLFQHLWCF